MLTTLLILAALGQVPAKNVPPQIGYMYPPCVRSGSTVDVTLGTYDWTPDMQVLVHDDRIKLEITGPAGDPILTPPPYWFANKAGQAQPPLAREVPARLTIPASFPPGPIHWQVANANGGSNVGTFVVTDTGLFIEPEHASGPLDLPALPIHVSGRLGRITEIDAYRFTVPAAGLIHCTLDDRLGQAFHGLLTIRDNAGRQMADSADTTGDGASVLFAAEAGASYTATVSDVEFAGDRGYVYDLSIARGPKIVATRPAIAARGKTTSIEFIGWGVASGQNQLESLTRDVSIPAASAEESFLYLLDTPGGQARVRLALAERADALEPAAANAAERPLTAGAAISGVLDAVDPERHQPLDRYQIAAKKGDILRFLVEAARFGSPVDPSLAILSADGQEIARSDDLPGSTDAGLDFKPPADGVYDVLITDVSGRTPSRANIYRLTVENPADEFDFTVIAPDQFDLPLGTSADLILKTSRRGDWQEPIEIQLVGLPEGVTLAPMPLPPPEPMPAARGVKKKPASKKAAPGDIKLTLVSDANSAATAALVQIVARATVEGRALQRRAGPMLVSTTLKTRCQVHSAVKDGGRLVNRGTTYPADVIIERLEGYEGPVTLQMAAAQQRQRRGIRGTPVLVPAGQTQAQFPIFMPEWLETSLTARMNVIGVVEIADPKGNVRHVTGAMDGLIVMSLEGALLKVSHEPQERVVRAGTTVEIPLRVSRSVKFSAPARVQLVASDAWAGQITAEPVALAVGETSAIMRLRVAEDVRVLGRQEVTFRATALEDGKWPVVSETAVPIHIEPSNSTAAR
jgi:hypothetical protein